MNISATDKSTEKEADFISVLLSTFSTIFIAELGDKTQIATLLFSAQSGHPIIVFFGASTALIISSLIAVLLGRWIASNIAEATFKLSAGVLMVCIAFLYGFQAIKAFSIHHSVI